jgi:hypothetical protein
VLTNGYCTVSVTLLWGRSPVWCVRSGAELAARFFFNGKSQGRAVQYSRRRIEVQIKMLVMVMVKKLGHVPFFLRRQQMANDELGWTRARGDPRFPSWDSLVLSPSEPVATGPLGPFFFRKRALSARPYSFQKRPAA